MNPADHPAHATSKDTPMRRHLIATALASLAALTAGSALAQMPSPEKIFKAWDKNADGGIDKAEWIAAGRKEARFAKADADADGKITLEELRAGMTRMKARPATPAAATDQPAPAAEH
jgi:hypothetical protein